MSSYLFRREDNGEVVEVDFATMMAQRGGYITLPDGVEARRCLHLELDRDGRRKRVGGRAVERAAIDRPHVSDNLSFNAKSLPKIQESVAQAGLRDKVTFVVDPQCPGRRQMKFARHKDFLRYGRHKGLDDRNGRSGAVLSAYSLEQAAELVSRAGHYD